MSWTILSAEWSQRSAERRHRQMLEKSFWYHLRHIVPWFLDMTSMLHITLAQVSSVTQLWSWETRPRWPNQCPDSLSLSYWQARVLIPSPIQVLNNFKSKLYIENGLGCLNNLCGQPLWLLCLKKRSQTLANSDLWLANISVSVILIGWCNSLTSYWLISSI